MSTRYGGWAMTDEHKDLGAGTCHVLRGLVGIIPDALVRNHLGCLGIASHGDRSRRFEEQIDECARDLCLRELEQAQRLSMVDEHGESCERSD